MKKIFLLVAVVFFLGCGATAPARTIGSFRFYSLPQGGYVVNNLFCSVTGKTSDRPITLTVEWWWENYFHANSQVKKTEYRIYDSTADFTHCFYYSLPAGNYFMNWWWVRISWTDDDGNHYLETPKVFCSYPVGRDSNLEMEKGGE